jgi:AcrR family transcriptional regulator
MALSAGARVFAADGLHAATMDQIAAVAGYAKPILYRHFHSKDDLFQAVVETECEQLVQHLFAAYARADRGSLVEQFREGAVAIADYAEKFPDGFRLLFLTGSHRSSTVAASRDAAQSRIIERVAQSFRRELKRLGRAHGQVADIMASMVVGLYVGVVQRMAESPRWNRQAIIELIASFLFAGSAGVPPEVLKGADRPVRSRAVKR